MSIAQKWNGEIPWQKDSNYIIRCIDESFSQSKSSNNPMITLKYEVVSPETMEVNGTAYNIAGVSLGLIQYFSTLSKDEDGNVNVEKTEACKDRIAKLYAAFEIPFDGFNPENPTLGFKGKTVYALLSNDAQEQRRSPTAAQLAAGQKQGDVLFNPKTKKPLMFNKPKVQEVFGLAPTDANAPY